MVNNRRRVVVTGAGCVSPYGIGTDIVWDAVVNGKSCIRKLENIKEEQTVRIGGEVPDFEIPDYINPKDARRLDELLSS